jgi:hypothetical protein
MPIATVYETALIGWLQTQGSLKRMHVVWVSIFFSEADIENVDMMQSYLS